MGRGLTAEIDDSNLSKFKDKQKENFFRELVVPQGLSEISGKIGIKPGGVIPPFDVFGQHCDDSENKEPSLEISTSFHESETDADYLLYLGVVDRPGAGWSAYASFCYKGSCGQ